MLMIDARKHEVWLPVSDALEGRTEVTAPSLPAVLLQSRIQSLMPR